MSTQKRQPHSRNRFVPVAFLAGLVLSSISCQSDIARRLEPSPSELEKLASSLDRERPGAERRDAGPRPNLKDAGSSDAGFPSTASDARASSGIDAALPSEGNHQGGAGSGGTSNGEPSSGGAGSGRAGAGGASGGNAGSGGASGGNAGSGGASGGNAGSGSRCPFGPPKLLNELDTGYWGPSPSRDGATLFLSSNTTGTSRLLQTTRTRRDAPYSPPTPVPGLNNDAFVRGTPFVSADGLTLYYYSTQGASAVRDIYNVQRDSITENFSSETRVSGVNSTRADHLPSLTADETLIVFTSQRGGGSGSSDIWSATRNAKGEDFSTAHELSTVNTELKEESPALSGNGLQLFFVSDRVGGRGRLDIWRSERESTDDEFSTPTNLAAVNTPHEERDVALSADDQELFFIVAGDAVPRIWHSLRRCESSRESRRKLLGY